jgi:hypothetical protein
LRHALRNQPSTEDFMLLADRGSGPDYDHAAGRNIWRTRPAGRIGLGDQRSFASLKDNEFADKAPESHGPIRSAQCSVATANPLVRSAFNNAVPSSMAEVARRYADLLTSIDGKWNDSLQQARTQKTASPEKFAEEAEEALRQVFYGPDGPPNIP